jgi:DNA-binding NtrC family response regulator
MPLILIVDDVRAMAEQYAYDLKRLGGFDTMMAGGGEEALAILAREPVDGVILDLEMPGIDGFEVLRTLSQRGIETPVIVYTGTGNFDRCIQAMRLGAYGFIDKAEPMERVVHEVESALERRRLRLELAILQRRLGETSLIGSSPALLRLREQIARVAPVPSTVLIAGESGSGKELVARDLHRLGPVHRHQLRGAAGAARRERALRARAGRIHRRRRHTAGRLRSGRTGHALPRRDR